MSALVGYECGSYLCRQIYVNISTYFSKAIKSTLEEDTFLARDHNGTSPFGTFKTKLHNISGEMFML